MSDLVERLRKMAATHERGFPVTILYSEISQALDIEAADRLAALEKENAELLAALKPFSDLADEIPVENFWPSNDMAIINRAREVFRSARPTLRDGGGE